MKCKFVGMNHIHEGVALVEGDIVELAEEQLLGLKDKFIAAENPVEPEADNSPEKFRDLVGPTIEEWVAAGYLPENYPPNGYAEVASAGLEKFKATGSL